MSTAGLVLVAAAWLISLLCWLEARAARRCVQDLADLTREHGDRRDRMLSEVMAKALHDAESSITLNADQLRRIGRSDGAA